MRKLFMVMLLLAAAAVYAETSVYGPGLPPGSSKDKAALEAYANDAAKPEHLRKVARVQIALVNKGTYTYEEQKAAVKAEFGDSKEKQMQLAQRFGTYMDEAWKEFGKAVTDTSVLQVYYLPHPDKYLVPTATWFDSLGSIREGGAKFARLCLKHLGGQCEKLPDEEAVKQLKRLNRRFSAHLTISNKELAAVWEQNVATVRTLLQAY